MLLGRSLLRPAFVAGVPSYCSAARWKRRRSLEDIKSRREPNDSTIVFLFLRGLIIPCVSYKRPLALPRPYLALPQLNYSSLRSKLSKNMMRIVVLHIRDAGGVDSFTAIHVWHCD